MGLVERLGGGAAITEGILVEFRGLCRAPHPSRHEGAESEYLRRRLEAMGLAPVRDGLGNLCCGVPAAPGREGAPTVILQGHMDMVCASAGDWDPLRDPVIPVVEGGFLRSDGRSSLGADNNLGNAAVLWLLGRGLSHGPLRLLFTVAEEVGLEGAKALDPAWLAGADCLINTDGFHLGRAVVSSAGGRRETFSRTVGAVPYAGGAAFRLGLAGCAGGHSGDDIHLGRCNPIRALADFLGGLDFPFRLGALDGGTAHNAIPAAARALAVVDRGDAAALAERWGALEGVLRARHAATDPGLTFSLAEEAPPERLWTDAFTRDALALLRGIFCGVYRYHGDFPGVVSASGNLGRVWEEGGALHAAAFLRCTDRLDERTLAGRHGALSARAGFSAAAAGYPSWTGRADDPLALLLDRVYRRETGKGMEITAVHVGLEPSFFQAKAPGLLMVSTGPDILDAHSVAERAPLAALPPYAALLAGALEELGTGRKCFT